MNRPALDDSELLQLGLQAMQQNRDEEAIAYFKRAIDAAPRNAKAHYLLAAEHAQLGLSDRAIEEMSRALELDPGLTVARFQLGLLHFSARRPREAAQAWEPLQRLPQGDSFRLFASALVHLSQNHVKECLAELRDGIANNKLNEPLNDDMRRFLQKLENASQGKDTTSRSDGTTDATLPSKRALLSAYDRNRNRNGEDR
jgi:tetratricopeptide (TPR) repeat protein